MNRERGFGYALDWVRYHGGWVVALPLFRLERMGMWVGSIGNRIVEWAERSHA